MAIREIETDTSALNRDANSMMQLLMRVERETGGMFEAVQELDAMWDGPANQAFVQTFQADYESMRALCRALRALTGCIERAAGSYQAGELRADDAVSAIKI